MIIVKLKGGLGNQLFQYAVGRHLAEIHKSAVKIDISFFKTYELHTYSIWPFNIQEIIATLEEVRALTDQSMGIVERATRRLLRRPPKLTKMHIQEKFFHFDPEILNLPDDIYLDGYWQSERYFADIANILRQEFTVKTPPAGKNKELADMMESCESVNLHIRRGSYLLPPHNTTHGTCTLDYYFRCVEIFTSTIKNPHFFIFCDEPQWAYDHLKLPYPATYIDHNDAKNDYEDLRLMSCCKNHIIANSTFSWWGAWLSTNHDKIVLCPERWFNDLNLYTKDLIPDTWIRVRG